MSSRKTKVINPPIQEPQNQQATQPQEIQQEIKEDKEPIQAPKKKRVVSEKTLLALKQGREALSKKWENDRITNKEMEEKYAIKKANKVIKHKMNIKKKYGVEGEDSEDEEPIQIIKEKKPKKKQIIVMPAESDSEEEIIYKKLSKKTPQAPQPPQPPQQGKIFFY